MPPRKISSRLHVSVLALAAWLVFVALGACLSSLPYALLFAIGLLLALCILCVGMLPTRFSANRQVTVPERAGESSLPSESGNATSVSRQGTAPPPAATAHESPASLNAIIGFSNLLLQTRLDPTQREYAQMIRKAALELLARTDDLAPLLGTTESAVLSPAFDLAECVEETLARIASAVNAKGLEVVHFVYSDVPAVAAGDPALLRAVLTRLVEGTAEWAARGDVIVRLMLDDETEEGMTLRLAVTANALHLNDAERASMLARLRSAGADAMPPELLQSLGIETDPGAGTTVFCILQYARPRAATPAAVPSNPLAGIRVLLCDPHPLVRLSIRHLLTHWQMNVTETDNLSEAIALLDEAQAAGSPFRCAVFGLSQLTTDMAPVQSALQTARNACAGPLIVLGGVAMPIPIRECADAWLSKPVNRRVLHQELLRLLEAAPTGPPAAETQRPDLAVYDREASVRLAGGNEQIADDLLAMLLAELPQQQRGLQEAFREGNMEELGRIAHKLHGSTCYCGVPALRAAAARLDACAATADRETIAAALDQLDQEITRLLDTQRAVPTG